MYYLDANTCIYFLNGKYEYIKTRMLATSPNEIAIPSIVKAELLIGAYKSKNRKANIEKVEKFLEGILVTHNVNEFSRIEGLKIEDWAR